MAESDGVSSPSKSLRVWIGGLVLFAIVIVVGLPLGIEEVPGGILDHQAAGTGEEVNRIQRAWMAAGLHSRAQIAMLGDLIFIGVYGWGSYLRGRWLWKEHVGLLKVMGLAIAVSAIAFLVTDYAETIAQLIQLTSQRGDDALAGLAAYMRPIKVATWIITFLGVLAAFGIRRISTRNA